LLVVKGSYSDHPNIVRLREVFFGKRHIMLVMDLCQGGELFEVLTGQGSKGFNEAYCARLLSDILAAVRYLHDHGVVHR
jgi:calcium-dependent protein kinase